MTPIAVGCNARGAKLPGIGDARDACVSTALTDHEAAMMSGVDRGVAPTIRIRSRCFSPTSGDARRS